MTRALRIGLIAVIAAGAVGLTVVGVRTAREARRASLEARAERDLASADTDVRVRCARDLAASAMGRDILERLVQLPPEDVVPELDAVEPVGGTAVRLTATLRNRGGQPAWVTVDWVSDLRVEVEAHARVDVWTWDGPALGRSARVDPRAGIGLGGTTHVTQTQGHGSTDVETFVRRARLLPAGGTLSAPLEHPVTWNQDLPVSLLVTARSRTSDAWEVTLPPDDRVFHAQSTRGGIGNSRGRARTLVVPDDWWRATAGDLRLRVTSAEIVPGRLDHLHVTAVVENRGPHPVLLPPASGDNPAGLFLLFRGADGREAVFAEPGMHRLDRRRHLFRTRARVERADPTPRPRNVVTVEDALVVPPGGTLTFTASVPMGNAMPAGRGRAVLGVVPHEAPADAREPGDDRPWVPFHGRLRSEPFEFTVPARD